MWQRSVIVFLKERRSWVLQSKSNFERTLNKYQHFSVTKANLYNQIYLRGCIKFLKRGHLKFSITFLVIKVQTAKLSIRLWSERNLNLLRCNAEIYEVFHLKYGSYYWVKLYKMQVEFRTLCIIPKRQFILISIT